jgi:hypothetical protein
MRFEVRKDVRIMMFFWLMTQCRLVRRYYIIGSTYYLHLHFGPEDGGSIFLRKCGVYLRAYMALQPCNKLYNEELQNSCS